MQIRTAAGLTAAVVAAALSAGAASGDATSAPKTVKTVKIANLGTVLATGGGLTLYRFTSDKKGTSSCSGACAALWPPLLVAGTAKPTGTAGVSASKLGTIRRSNGQEQVTYGGFPLYRYAADTQPGQAKGEGLEGTWFAVAGSGSLVKPTAGPVAATTTTPASTTSSNGGAAGYGY